MRGLFITFEGPDASGKTTQIDILKKRLENSGMDPLVTREPGGTFVGEKIREILLDKNNAGITPVAEMLLYAASRAQHVSEVIKPALESGRTVISDRFYDSSEAYQGYGRGLGKMVWRVNEPAVDGIWPDLTIMLMADPDDVKGRRADSEKDRMDSESLAFQQRVKKGFEAVAERDSDRILRIDAGKSIEEIADEIAAAVERLAGRKI
ncbi:MAG: dTMP kinase [Anaerovoracaceae bacterium]|nr:dTMP kinase [Bacillota bacterium]MDY2671488.1 dTMP kinase [Anaerovoracaceae bacterium]